MDKQDRYILSPSDERLYYMGRIDQSDPWKRTFIYAASAVYFRFTGTDVGIRIRNFRSYFRNFIGYSIDGKLSKVEITEAGEPCLLMLDTGLLRAEHTVCIWKCQDAAHYFDLLDIVLDTDAELLSAPAPFCRRMEFYGDSVTCGEVSEAVEYVGQSDPQNEGEYSNAYYSYAWMTARKLNAGLHNVSQGGIALLDGTGYFAAPDYVGMESVYDKLRYQPQLSEVTPWDFTAYIPHVVVVAIGQNDAHPDNYMGKDEKKSSHWKEQYRKLLAAFRVHYPNALILLTTTILCHDKTWDDALDEIAKQMKDDKIKHFMYTKNGVGTPGHIRIPEAEEMSDELAAYIRSFGEDIWKDE